MRKELALIQRIIEEHKVIKKGMQALEQKANDAEALMGLEQAKEAFMPGRLEPKKGLQMLQESLGAIEKGLQKHFDFEETGLPSVVGRYGDEEVKASLNSLFLEHKDLRSRMAHSKKHIADLVSGNLSRQLWEASAHDMRAHISHTRKLLEAHAEIEQELLHQLQDQLQKESKTA